MGVQEIVLTIGNRPGTLQRVARLLVEGRINVASISLNPNGQKSTLRMVVSDPVRALWLLRKSGYKVDAADLLMVSMEDKVGSLLGVLDVLARHEINIASVTILVMREGRRAILGLGVYEPLRARRILTDAGLLSERAERLVTNAELMARAVVEAPTGFVGPLS